MKVWDVAVSRFVVPLSVVRCPSSFFWSFGLSLVWRMIEEKDGWLCLIDRLGVGVGKRAGEG